MDYILNIYKFFQHGRAFRDLETEAQVLKMTQKMGIGAQFGGKYFCHDVRVIRLPRHGARYIPSTVNKIFNLVNYCLLLGVL